MMMITQAFSQSQNMTHVGQRIATLIAITMAANISGASGKDKFGCSVEARLFNPQMESRR